MVIFRYMKGITKTFLLIIFLIFFILPLNQIDLVSAAAPTNGLAGYWKFDEGSGDIENFT